MDYDFSGLTSRQHWLILFNGWRIGQTYPDGRAWPQPSKQTVKKLIDRGLMVERTVREFDPRFGSMDITEYHVPLLVHMAYCMRFLNLSPEISE